MPGVAGIPFGRAHRAVAFDSARKPGDGPRKMAHFNWSDAMSLGMILLIVLILVLAGAIPTWPHSRSWGFAPSGVVGLLLVILVVMLVTGRV